jgi:pyruvate-formate lyase-activating enzyme
VPLSINLDLTTACNYACDHCIDWEALNQPARHDELALFDSLEYLAANGLRSVILLGGGEPTLHPAFSRVVRFLKELGLQVAVVTNGSRNEVIAAVADAFTSGDWVRLSLDAGTDELFRAMHKPRSADLTLTAILKSAGQIKSTNSELSLGFSFVMTWRGALRHDIQVLENLDEMAFAAQRAKSAGFDYISFKPFLTRAMEGAEVMSPDAALEAHEVLLTRIQAQLTRATALQDDAFRVVESTNLRVLIQNTWQEMTRQPAICHMQAFRQVLSPLGVFNCPAHRGVAKARIGEAHDWAPQDGVAKATSATSALLDSFDACHECAEVTCLYHGVNHLFERLIESGQDLETAFPEVAGRRDSFL